MATIHSMDVVLPIKGNTNLRLRSSPNPRN